MTFDIDANGIVSVNAKDLGTGKSQAMTITGGTALSKEEIDRMNADAEAHAEEDRARRETVEARNNADNVSYQTEKLLKEHEDLLSDEEKDEINQKLTELKAVLGNEEADAGELGEKADAVIAASQVFGQRINEAAAAAGQAEGAARGNQRGGRRGGRRRRDRRRRRVMADEPRPTDTTPVTEEDCRRAHSHAAGRPGGRS